LFLIFINDLPSLLKKLSTKLFADDTTIVKSGSKILPLIDFFKKEIQPLFNWCNFNRIDINFAKTYIMFIHNKRKIDDIPKFIDFGNNIHVQVVDEFKLLGVTLDSKLNFQKHVANIMLSINRKLYSIKRLFFLSFKLKMQFFKTFILPYFDYCSTLSIYFAKTTMLKLCNCFYYCLFKLFKWNFNDKTTNDIHLILKDFNLFSFQHRNFYRISMLIFKIYFKQQPPLLYQLILDNVNTNNRPATRSQTKLSSRPLMRIPVPKNKFGKSTIGFIMCSFINKFFVNSTQSIKLYSDALKDNICNLYMDYCDLFEKFNLNGKIFIKKKTN
jgi:hypothetical protein